MGTALAAITAFSATNIDDIIILMLLFSRLNQRFRAVHVVSGQFLGIAALVLISLTGQLGRTALPETWLGLLGLVPIALGIVQVQGLLAADASEPNPSTDNLEDIGSLEVAGVLGVATITIANGSDNLGVYIPMFASNSSNELKITVLVFVVLTAIWCLLGWWLTRLPGLASLLRRYGTALLPAVLVALGGSVLHDCHTLADPALAAVTLTVLAGLLLHLGRQLQTQLQTQLQVQLQVQSLSSGSQP